MIIKIDINEEMYKATKLYLTKKGFDDKELEQLIEKGATEALAKAYGKYVPKATREYIDLLNSSLSDKKKTVSQDTVKKEENTSEQSSIGGQDY